MVDTVIARGVTRNERLDMSGADSLRVNGVFSVGDENETVRFDAATEDALIVNRGVLENVADDGRAIRFETEIGDALTARIANFGDIRSANDAVQIQDGTLAAGRLAIDNAEGAEIVADAGQALDLADAGGDFVLDLANAGKIIGETNDGVRIGSFAEIVNAGVIGGGRADGYDGSVDGVQFEEGASGWIRNDAPGALIYGDRHGVNADEGTTISVVNGAGARIVGHNGSGVGSDGSATVINRGSIIGAFSDSEGSDTNGSTPGAEDGGGPDGINDGDGDGVDVDGFATIQNYGVIRGTGAGGNGSDGFANTAEGIAAGGGVIENFAGATIAGAGLGILIDDSSRGNAPFLTEVVNHGTITAGSGAAIKIVSSLDDTIENAGLIRGGDGVAVEFGSGDNHLSIADGSRIVGLSIGGDGVDTLSYGGFTRSVTVELASGEATGTGGVEGFENVTGSRVGDRISGDDGANRLDGAGGADTLAGGDGDDVYLVNGLVDVVHEAAGSGHDTVLVGSSFRLAAGEEIEAMRLMSAEGGALVGNAFDNRLTGAAGEDVLRAGAGNDTLIGGRGADTMTGGSGEDVFAFTTSLARGHADVITDFATGRDTLRLDDAVFLDLTVGALSDDAFTFGVVARDAEDRVIYDQASGALLFDRDGSGEDFSAVKFAELQPGLALSASDFTIA
jgi:Ca2+-binding RTX toxin-like protein